MKLQKVAGVTSEIWQVFIRDSSSTTGAGLTGLVFNSASLTAYYHRDTDTTATAISLVTMTVGTFTSSGFKEIDATNMPGWYQFCPPNAALAAGAKSCGFHLKGAANMAPLPIEVQLISVNLDDAVRGGMTALPNANAEAAGGLYTRGTGAGQINQNANGSVDTNTKTWNGLTTVALPLVPTTAGRTLDVSAGGEAGIDWANVGTPGSAVNLAFTTVNTVNSASVGAIGSGVITATSIAANAITAAKLATDAIGSAQLAQTAVDEIAAGLLDLAAGVETNQTVRQALRIMLSAMAGKASGLATATASYRDTNDTKDRIVATVDADGNRTAVTLDAT